MTFKWQFTATKRDAQQLSKCQLSEYNAALPLSLIGTSMFIIATVHNDNQVPWSQTVDSSMLFWKGETEERTTLWFDGQVVAWSSSRKDKPESWGLRKCCICKYNFYYLSIARGAQSTPYCKGLNTPCKGLPRFPIWAISGSESKTEVNAGKQGGSSTLLPLCIHIGF